MGWLWIIAALIVGLVVGYWLARRAFEEGPATEAAPQTSSAAVVAPVAEAAAPAPVNRPAETAVSPEPAPSTDDLTTIEGIGPKIAELLAAGGLPSFRDLAGVPVERLQELLDAAGPRYRVHNPASWPSQATLAADGKWDELAALQDRLDGGKIT